ncbi:hypothetical protein BGZ76_005568, partial [Entomortierella beljakovae]
TSAPKKRKETSDHVIQSNVKSRRKSVEVENDDLSEEEVEEFISKITSVEHQDCEAWVQDGVCIPCLVTQYQKAAIAALRQREVKKSNPADYMILMGIFAPFSPTPLMNKIFGTRRLKAIKQSFELELESNTTEINDSCILSAIRLKMNGKEERALDALSAVTNRKLRNMFEQLIINLPKKEDPPDAEETLITNFISPILRALLQNTEDEIITHFPNTESKAQKNQGMVPDRPDFKITLGGMESSFGEVTGYQQKTDRSKNGFDLWRLARYGKSVLDEGTPMVPLIQIIYEKGIIYRLVVRARGVMVLAEVGIFTVPMYLNAIATLQTSLPTLEWYK